jgi:drug/metabolite transporter (DMT)-like permease
MKTLNLAARRTGHLRTKATLMGAAAVLMWSSLAPLTAAAQGIPPLQLLAATFCIAFLCGLTWLFIAGGRSAVRRLKQPLPYLGFAAGALFGYHALYFAALGSQAEPIRSAHVVGALLGLVGTALLVLSRSEGNPTVPGRSLGLLAALACAVIWSGYSVLNRRFRDVPSDAMVGVCGIVAILGWLAHVIIDSRTVLPSVSQWGAIAALGVGPVGIAFLAWDYGTKHGHLGLLGSISYAAPVLSTLLLVTRGYAQASLNLLAACALVVGGSWIATASNRTNDPELQR